MAPAAELLPQAETPTSELIVRRIRARGAVARREVLVLLAGLDRPIRHEARSPGWWSRRYLYVLRRIDRPRRAEFTDETRDTLANPRALIEVLSDSLECEVYAGVREPEA